MRVLSPLVALVVFPTIGLSACGKSEPIGVSTNPDAIAAAIGPSADKGDSACLEPNEVRVGKEYACADGKKRKGTLFVGAAGTAVLACTADNEKGCLTTEEFSAFAKIERAN